MQIIDLEGKEIKVTDLDKAIEQADTFRNMGDEADEFEKERKAYWQDLYDKLIKLKQ